MAHTRTWNAALEAIPPNSQAASQGATRIRDFKLDFRERFELDHVMDESNDDGFHKQVTLEEQPSSPSNIANKGRLFTKDVSGETELFYIDAGGTEFRITDNGKLLLLGTNNSWTKGQATPEVSVTYASTITPDASLSNAFRVTLTGNVILAPPSNPKDGQVLTIRFLQDGTGSRILSFGSTLYGNTNDDLALSTDAGKHDFLTLFYNGAGSKWYVLNLKKDINNAL